MSTKSKAEDRVTFLQNTVNWQQIQLVKLATILKLPSHLKVEDLTSWAEKQMAELDRLQKGTQ